MTDFETKDSGKRAEFSNGGVRDTQEGKPRFDLCWPKNVPYDDQLLTRFAALMARGAEKYSDRNWEQFSDEAALERARSSAMRHQVQWFNGETDEDHAAAVLFNIMAADYVSGVLEGRWEAQTSNDRAQPLWTGTYADPEPPAHVKILRIKEYLLRLPTEDPDTLIRHKDGSWGFRRDIEQYGSTNVFNWPGSFDYPPYLFEEVRND